MSSLVRNLSAAALLLVASTLAAEEVLPAPSAPAASPCTSGACELGGCDVGCCDGWQCCRPSKWRHLCVWLTPGCFCTTGMMHPHYPYFPERHGYYDFAPYNAGVLREQMRLAPALGDSTENPFARAGFESVYASLPNTDYPGEADAGMVPQLDRVEVSLPDLDAILDAGKPAPTKPPEPSLD